MPSVNEIMRLCRLCLVKEQVHVPIFEGESDARQIFHKISTCLPVMVAPDDRLPKNVCDGCSEKLNMTYEFWNKSNKSEKQLLEWLGQATSEDTQLTHSINPEDVILKQEVVDIEAEDNKADEDGNNDNDDDDDDDVPLDDPMDPDFTLQPQDYEKFEHDKEVASTSAAGTSSNTPVPRRKRRAAAMRSPYPPRVHSEEEEDDPVETKVAKTEKESDDEEDTTIGPAFVNVPTDNELPGPSGLDANNEVPVFRVRIKELKSMLHVKKKASQKSATQPKKSPAKKQKKKRDSSSERDSDIEKVDLTFLKDEPPLNEEDEESKFICHICKNDYKMSASELKKHFKEEHKGKRLRCMKLHKEDAVCCDLCPKRFRTLRSLKEHIETHSNQFSCDTCNQHFKKVLDYTLHLRLHNPEEIFTCALCDFKTDSINDITSHVNSLHNQNYKYTCRKCGKGFHVYSWYREHDNYHTGARPFECEYCLKTFPYSRYLNAHKNTIHKEDITGVPNYHECVICKKRYQHKNSLRLHMNVHTGNVAICDICGKTLSSTEKLKFHVRIHTGYKPFSCSYCGKCFTKKPMLIEHERVHTGEKPYTCEFCLKGFSQRSSLVIHMRGHTGERPYVCHICNKGFTARAMLNVHFRTCKGIVE